MPKDQDELRLKDLEVQIQEHRAALSIMEFEFNKLKEDLRRKKRLQVDTKIEADMGAWYMRYLWENEFLRKVERLPLDEAVRKALERGNLKPG
jgi:hypothetical protein